MDYTELKHIFRELKRSHPKKDLTAHIIFTEDSFDDSYPLLSRTYTFTSDNKAFWSKLGGYSIFASCLDGTEARIPEVLEQPARLGAIHLRMGMGMFQLAASMSRLTTSSLRLTETKG